MSLLDSTPFPLVTPEMVSETLLFSRQIHASQEGLSPLNLAFSGARGKRANYVFLPLILFLLVRIPR